MHIGNVGLFVVTMSGDPVWSARFDPYPMHLDFGTAASGAVDDELVYVLNDNQTRSPHPPSPTAPCSSGR